MDIIKKAVCTASLIAFIILAVGFGALGAGYSVGSGNDDWWTKYPDQSAGKGGEVNHPAWILDALGSKPVVIYVHKGCDYCTPQTDALTKIEDEMGDKFTYFNISADGSDARSEEALQAYDPNSGVMYVPLTGRAGLAQHRCGHWRGLDQELHRGCSKSI
jgi:glutaredoxin